MITNLGFTLEESFSLTTQVVDWLIAEHNIYVEATCFNGRSWGLRLYQLNDQIDTGAPIIYEKEPSYYTREEALLQGIVIAINIKS